MINVGIIGCGFVGGVGYIGSHTIIELYKAGHTDVVVGLRLTNGCSAVAFF